jgi:hypothetical protein
MNEMLMPDPGKKRYAFRVSALLVLLAAVICLVSSQEVMAQDATPVATAVSAAGESAAADYEAPIIDFWYGPNQLFGQIGTTQEWVNILGNVSDPDGIDTLVFSLNGGVERPLSIGPDGKRLANKGDFNVELWRGELLDGTNELIISASDTFSNQATAAVTIEHHSGNMWPFPYEIVWSEVENIQDVAQVVDGKWTTGPEGLRTAEIGNDRMVAIGDLVWTDYEVLVPMTIRRVQKDNVDGLSPALGVIMRWTGHTASESDSEEQPRSAFQRNTAIAWWHWQKTTKLEFDHNGQIPFEPRIGVPYLFKVRSETLPDQRAQYSVKAWVESQPEPDEWQVTYQAKASASLSGSLVLLARYVDVVFGDPTVTGLVPLPTPTPLPSETPTTTPTPTVTNTPPPTNAPTITATATATPTASVLVVTGASATGVDSRSRASDDQGSSPLSDSLPLYGTAFAVLAVILIGLALVRRQLMS